MGRQDYAVSEIGAYGVRAQPAVVARMRPHLRLTRIGVVASAVAVGAAIGALATFAQFTGWGLLFPLLLLGAAVVMAAVCALQAWVWSEAMAEWSGRRDVNLARWVGPSYAAHVVSYVAGLVGIAGAAWLMGDAGPATASFWWALVAVSALVGAQLTAAVEFLRLDGPPGTLPAHFRRLLRLENDDVRGRERAAEAVGILRDGGIDDGAPPTS